MGAFQELEQLSMMRPITKLAVKVPTTQRIPEYLEMAFRTATSGRPGPVHLDIPHDVLTAEWDFGDDEFSTAPERYRFTGTLRARPTMTPPVSAPQWSTSPASLGPASW